MLTIGILAILLIGLGVNYGRQMTEQSRLRADIAQGQLDFDEARQGFTEDTARYTARKEDLETRLNQANSTITSIQSELRQCTESIEISEALFQAARDANVTIIELRSSLPQEEKQSLSEEEKPAGPEEAPTIITYRVVSIDVTAEGEVVALLNFSRKLSETFSTATIESVQIDVAKRKGEEEETEQKSTMHLRLRIYAYQSA